MGGIAAAYLATLGVIGFKWGKVGQFPPPIALGGATVIFAGCGIIGGIQGGEGFANVLAWGFVLGAIFSPSFGDTVSPVLFGSAPAPTVAPSDSQIANGAGVLSGQALGISPLTTKP